MNCQICRKEKYHHKHRIISGVYGGKYTKANTCYLCANCHFKTHKGEIIIEGFFQTTDGIKLIWHLKNESSFTNMEQIDKVYLT